MGRLNHAAGKLLTNQRLRQLILAWALPVILAAALLAGVHARVAANSAPSSNELQTFLQNNKLQVYENVADNYPQIFYLYNGQSYQITSENYAHLHPVASGHYVTWQAVVNGQGQVFLYDVLTGSQIQLSTVAPNEGIYMQDDKVSWQGWDGNNWQIYFYNGTTANQITTGPNSSVHSATNGRQIIYAEQLSNDDWKAQSYDLGTGQVTTIRQGDTASTAYPRFAADGSVTTAFIP